ncbi:MAG TPA: OsmC family protein [Gemmatimonadaceae bacterium]|nr:OsmC family protein [Gemmatimonadaceae bacterium]
MSAPSRVFVDWKGDRRFEAAREGRPAILLDGDGNSAPTPPDALLASFASCVSVDVVDILAKRRTPVESYTVEVLGERVDTIPRRFTRITFNISIDGAGIERTPAEHAIDLSVTKYCSVGASLDPSIQVSWNLTLNGDGAT